MTEMQKLAYESTLQRLREAFPDNPAPFIAQVATYLKCHRYALTGDRSFAKLTYGNRRKRISLENLAIWQCRIS